MSSRVFDLIIYGATGFTGEKVAKALYSKQTNLKWAIAGRSKDKLDMVLRALGSENLPGVLVADVSQPVQLQEVFSQSRLVLNCTGPYRFLGAPIVEACITCGTDYMDISGEPQFLEQSFLNYHEAASVKNVLVLHACAFDSVPADLGSLFVMRQFPEHCCSSIESFLRIDCGPEGVGGHYTTYECAVHGFGDVDNLKKTRVAADVKYQPPKLEFCGPKLERKAGFFFEKRIGRYSMPFMGADAAVVKSSQRMLAMTTGQKQWPQYAAYATVDSWGSMAKTAVFGSIFQTLAQFGFGRSLLLQYPETFTNGLFSHKGPTTKQMESTSFTMQFFAKGYSNADDSNRISKSCLPNREIVAKVSGPEPGYVATPLIFLSLAEVLLEERTSMPQGGVLTPAAAFYSSRSVYQKLTSVGGIKFEVEQVVEPSDAAVSAQGRSNL